MTMTDTDPQAAEAETIRAAIETLHQGAKCVDIELRAPLADWLEDAREGDNEGVINPYAAVMAAAILTNRGSRRHP